MKKSVLIIGRPNSTKTRYLTQFMIRCEENKGEVRLLKQPDDKSAIWADLKVVSNGKKSERTPSESKSKVELLVEIGGESVQIAYPDSSGEMVNAIIQSRRLGETWKADVENSNYWVLFIRPSDVSTPFNTMTKKVEPNGTEGNPIPGVTLGDQDFYIELLQILLFVKGIGQSRKVSSPKLAVALTCWDELNLSEDVVPQTILQSVLPLVYEYLSSIWEESAFSIFGLSPQGRALTKDIDEDFIDSGPENNGYIILPNGKDHPDITKLIGSLIR